MVNKIWTDGEIRVAENVIQTRIGEMVLASSERLSKALTDAKRTIMIDLQCELNEARKLLEQAWAPYPAGMEWSAYGEQEWRDLKKDWLSRNGSKGEQD